MHVASLSRGIVSVVSLGIISVPQAQHSGGSGMAEDTQSNLVRNSGSLYISVGCDLSSDTFWSGLIDEVRIYNRALT